MKKLSLIVAALVICGSAFSQSKSVEAFHNKYKDDRDASVVTLNGNIFGLISNIAGFSEEEDAQTVSRIAKGINSMNVLALPMDKIGISVKEIDNLRDDIKKEGYEEMMTVRDGRERVYFLAKTNKSQINNMLILTNKDDDEFVLINLDGILEMKDLAYLADHHKEWSK
ncbi:MAG: DUF4252 domain-containing protein [Fulvivirga sp.]|uniref:DUF4252 domain-containing protein n=1 Tax=Fulvivirga sp. TaxID=1931237 RepID=UPI0032EF5DCB